MDRSQISPLTSVMTVDTNQRNPSWHVRLGPYTRRMNNYTCTQCGTVGLAEGFIEDAGEHSRGYARWIEGALERGFFGGAKRLGRPRRQIEAYRCSKVRTP